MPTPTAPTASAPPPVAIGQPPRLSVRGDLWAPAQGQGRVPWTWLVAPDRLTVRSGHIVPQMIKATWTSGGVNSRATIDDDQHPQRAQGHIAVLRAEGAVEVPHGMRGLVAFGESRDGRESAYMDLYYSRDGRTVYAAEAWERPTRIGMTTIWRRDEEGWLGFLRACMGLIGGSDLDPVQVEMATLPTIRLAREYAHRDGGRSRQIAEMYARQLPLAHVPVDLRHLVEIPSREAPTDP